MKSLSVIALLLCSFLITTTINAQTLTKKWRTDTLLKVPESVLWDAKNKVLYVACIDGKPDGKDGIGSIGKVGADGKIINASWVKGLNAPKGMGLNKNLLYVADIDEVAVIDITTGKVTEKVAVPGAKFLNDITIDKNGEVFVSDTGTGKIHKIAKGKAELYFESTDFKGINGLLAIESGLYIVDYGSGFSYILNHEKKLTRVGETNVGSDGVVSVGKNEYLVSIWEGEIYFVNAENKATKIIDTKEAKLSSADIWYDAASSTLYVPTFFSNSVIAYTFKR